MGEVTTTTNNQLGFMAQAANTFEGVQKLSEIMAKCGTLPKHLQGQPSDCFRVVVQACKWGMDPFAVAECTSVVHGRLCFEGKLVAAVLTSMNAIEGRLEYEIEGTGQNASITVIGTPKGAKKPVSLGGSVKQWRTHTKKDGREIPNAWDSMPETMLIYRGTRQWARVYAPEAVLGVYTPDEMEEETIRPATAEVVDSTPAKRREIPAVQQEEEVPPEPEQQAEPEQAPDVDHHAKCKAYIAALFKSGGGKAALKEVLDKHGIPRLQDADPSILPALHTDLKDAAEMVGV